MRTTRTLAGPIAEPVRELFEVPGPVCSVYARAGAGAEGERELRRRRLVADLTAQHADPASVRAVADHLTRLTGEPGTEALFAADGQVLAAFRLTGAEPPESAVWGQVPRVVPVLHWYQERPAHVLALVDRAGADVLAWDCGAAAPLLRHVTGPDDEIERNAPGGWAQMRYQHRAEDSWQHNAAAVAEEIAAALDRHAAGLLLLAGDVRAVQYLERYLPARVHRETGVVHLPGGRAPEREAQRGGRVGLAVREASEAETDRLLAAVAEGLGRVGLAVEGVQATVEALAAARVHTLLVTGDPADERRLWVGPGATDLAQHHLPRPAGWPWALREPLADAAVHAAVLADADVRVLGADRPGAPAGGLAALCRYA